MKTINNLAKPPKTTISKSTKSISTITDNMALKRITDTCLLGLFRLEKLSSEEFYPVNLALFKELSDFKGHASVSNALQELKSLNNINEETKQDIIEAYSLSMVEETDEYRISYRPITAIKVDKISGLVSLRFSPEILKMVQGGLAGKRKDSYGKEVDVVKFSKGDFYQQDVRMLGVSSSVHAMYDMIAKELWKGSFSLDYKKIRETIGLDYVFNGRKITKYKAFGDFNRNILLKTKEKMEERLGIVLDIEYSRGTKGITKINFTRGDRDNG